jgi:hypothetical protein
VGLGLGNAVCDNEKPNSDCPVDGAFTLGFGGGWRFHDNFAVGGELGIWAFKVRDEWQGQLDDKATDVTFSSLYLAPYLRWYWFDEGGIDPYLQAGVGIGSVTAEASNDSGTYTYSATGFVFPVGIGVDWYVSDGFRRSRTATSRASHRREPRMASGRGLLFLGGSWRWARSRWATREPGSEAQPRKSHARPYVAKVPISTMTTTSTATVDQFQLLRSRRATGTPGA